MLTRTMLASELMRFACRLDGYALSESSHLVDHLLGHSCMRIKLPLQVLRYTSASHCVLQVVEGRLFSEGLHVLGQPPNEGHMRQYLEAYFDNSLPSEAVDALVAAEDATVDTVRQRLERSFEQVGRLQPV